MSANHLDFDSYQREALATDQSKKDGETSLLLPLLGLVGEIGTLATEQKKRIRDSEKHELFAKRIAEDLGDILWYLSNFASKSGSPPGLVGRSWPVMDRSEANPTTAELE